MDEETETKEVSGFFTLIPLSSCYNALCCAVTSVVSNSFQPYGLQPASSFVQTRILYWVEKPSSKGIFLTQRWNLHLLGLLHWVLYHLALSGKPPLVAIGVFKRSNSNSTKDKAFLLLCMHHILYTLVSLQQEHCNYSQLTGEKMEAYRCKIVFPMPSLR